MIAPREAQTRSVDPVNYRGFTAHGPHVRTPCGPRPLPWAKAGLERGSGCSNSKRIAAG